MPRDVRLQERQVGGAIELGTAPQTGFWEQHGYDTDAWIGRSNGF